jgi:hypothetical protein
MARNTFEASFLEPADGSGHPVRFLLYIETRANPRQTCMPCSRTKEYRKPHPDLATVAPVLTSRCQLRAPPSPDVTR